MLTPLIPGSVPEFLDFFGLIPIGQVTIDREGDDRLGNLAEYLMEELECETVFKIPIRIPQIAAYADGIPVHESIVVTWIIMAVLILVSIILTRNLKVDHISKRQAVAELIVTKLTGMVEGMIGENGKAYVPWTHMNSRDRCRLAQKWNSFTAAG